MRNFNTVLAITFFVFLVFNAVDLQGQNNNYSVRSDTVCNLDTGVLEAYNEIVDFANIPKAADSVEIKFAAGFEDNGFSDYITLFDEDSTYYDTLGPNINVGCNNFDSFTKKVSANTFNTWLTDDTVTFEIQPDSTGGITFGCNCANNSSDCRGSSLCSQCSSVFCDIFYKSTIELNYNPLKAYQKTYGDSLADIGHGLTNLDNDGAVVTGETQSFGEGQKDAFLMKTSDEGDEQWYKTYGGSSDEVGKAVTQRHDSNGYLLTGYTESFGQGGRDFFVIKTDSSGNVVWEQTYGGTNNEEAYAIIKTADTNYLVAGYTQSFGASGKGIYLVKIDTAGNILWDYRYGEADDELAYDVIQDSSKDYVLTGGTTSFGAGGDDVFVLKLDSTGNVNWLQTYGGSNDESGQSIIQSDTGDYVVGGRSFTYSSGSDENGIFLRLDTSGSVQNFNAFGGSSKDYFTGIREAESDSFILSGTTQSYGNGGKDGFVAKVDSAGQVSWARAFGDTGGETINAISFSNLTTDDILAVGKMTSFGLGQSDVYLLSLEDDGFGQCNQSNLNNVAFSASTSSQSRLLSKTAVTTQTNSGLVTNKPANQTYLLCPVDADFAYANQCWGDTTDFSDSTFEASHDGYSWSWDFGDTASANNTDTLENPSHFFSGADSFDVQLFASTGAASDTATKSISITAKPLNILTKDTGICKYDSLQLQVDSTGYETYEWSPINRVSDDTIAEPYAYPGLDSNLVLRVSDSKGCQNYDTVKIGLDSTAALEPSRFRQLTTVNPSTIGLSWDTTNDRSRFLSYRIYRKKQGANQYQYLDSVTYFDTTAWEDTSLSATDSNPYNYLIKAENNCGILSDSSNILRSIVISDSTVTDKKLHLSWTATSFDDSSKYELLYDEGVGFQLDTTLYQDTSFNRIACSNDGKFKVRAIDTAKNDTVVSNVIDPALKDTTPAPAPIFSASHFGINQENQYRVTFGNSDSRDLDQYILFRSVNNKPYINIDTLDAYTITAWNILSYPDSQNVCFRIQTIDSCGNLSDTSSPHCLANISATPGNYQNNLYWKPYEGFNSDTVEVQRYTSGTWKNLAYLNGSDTSYTDKSLSCKKSYFYRVKYYEAGGNDQTSLSDSVRVTPIDTISPDKPKIHQATVLNDSTTELSWAPSSGDVNRYVVYRDDASNNFNAIDTLSGRSDTNYTDSLNNAIDRSYCYKVKAIDSCADNQSSLSEEHCTIYLTSDTTGCTQEISLSWNKYESWDTVQQYEIYRQQEGGSRKLLATVDSTVTSYVDSQVDFNFNFTYDIKALDKNTAFTSSSNDTTNRTFEPNIPFVQSASKLTTYPDTGKVDISWNNQQSEPKLAYQNLYYKAPDSNNFDLLKDSIPLSQDSFIHQGLNTKFKDHRYYLTTVDKCGNESDSAAIHKTMELEFDVGQLAHDLSWTPYEGWPVKHYLVQRQQGGAFKTLDTLPAGDTSIFKQPEPCNFAISYRIKVMDSNSNFAYSDTGINKAIDTLNPDRAQLTNVTIPQDSVVKITFTGADSLDIFAYDVMRKREGTNYQLAERVIFNTAGGNFTVYDTINTRPDQLSYKVLTQDSCLNTVSSDSFTATQLEGKEQNLENLLTWHKFEGYPIDSQYLLEKSGANYDTLAQLGNSDTSFLHDNLRCNQPHSYKVLSFEQGGNRQTLSDSIRLKPFDTVKPAAPNLFRATVQNSDSIRIAWDTSTDIDVNKYEIFYAKRGQSFQSAVIIKQENKQVNEFVQNSIDPKANSYCYYVEAIDSCSSVHSIPSDTHCVMELNGEPGNLRSELSWAPYTGSKPVDSYTVQRRQDGPWKDIAVIDGDDTTYTDSQNLRCNQYYRYRIRAKWEDDSTLTSLSDTAWVKPFDTVKPAAPDFRNATVQNSDSVEITWDTSTDIDVNQYEVFYAKRGQTFQSAGIIAQENKPQNDFVQQGINPKTESYCYYVEAIDSCSDVHSMPSDTHCVMQLEAKGGQRENHLHWDAYSGPKVDSYTVERLFSGGWKSIASVPGTDNSYTDDSSTRCNIPYRYRIRAHWEDGNSFTSLSDSARSVPFDTVNPAKTNINAFSVIGKDSAEVTWQLSDGDVKQYELWVKSRQGTWQNRDTVGVQTRYTFGNLNTLDSQYCTRIVAIDSCSSNRSGFSQKHCAVELQGTPGNLETTLNWHPYEGFFNPTYQIQRKTTNTSWQTLGSKTDTNFNDTQSLACNVTYTYRVRTVSPSGSDTSYSDTLNLQPFDTTAPPAPQLRFASANLQNEVELEWAWDTKSDQKYFEIWRDQCNGNYTIRDTITYNSIYLDASATPGQTTHAYFVRAIDSCAANGTIGAPGNRSTPSDTDRIMVPEVETGGCQPEARLSWSPYQDLPKGADYYRIHRRDSNSNNFQQVARVGDTAYTDSNILDHTSYCYRIEAIDTQSGYTAYSDSICMQPFVYPIPDTARIKRTTVTKTGQSNGEILVEWERSPRSDTFARGYYIYHRQNGGNYALIQNQTDLDDTTFRHQGINTAKFPHQYRVVIYNLCLEDGGYRKVHRPVKLYGENRNLEIALDWLPYRGFDVKRYEVQRSFNGGPFRSLDTLMSRDTSYRDSSVRCGNLYSYRIYAEGSKGHEQSLSDSIGFVAYDTIPPDRADINRGTIVETNATNGIAELDFEPASQANRKGYIIYRSEDNSRFVPVDTVFSNSTNTITYSDSNLNTKYSILGYYIRSFDSCGNIAAPSDTHQLINLQAEAKNLANEVNWTAYQGWNDWLYELQRRTPNTNWATIARQDTGNLTYTDSTKNCDTLYYYRVKGMNTGTGEVTYSNYDTAQSIDQKAPEPPQMERVSVEENGAVQVEWTPSVSEDQEFDHLFRKPASNPNFEPQTTNLQTTNYTDSQSNANEEPISYRLRSEDSCKNVSKPSEIHSTIHLEAEPGQEQNELTWTAYEGWDVASYEVYKDGSKLTELDGDELSYTDVRAVCTTYHNYRIRAIKENGEEVFSWSNTDSAQALDNSPPQSVNLTAATVVKPNEVLEIRWEASTAYDADGYEIYRSGLNSTGLTLIATIENRQTTAFRDSLNSRANEQFCYQVRVRDFCGNLSQRSNNGCVMGIEGDATEGTNQISWDKYYEWPGNIAYYEVYKKEGSSFYEQIGQTEAPNFTDEDLANQVTNFCYQVEAHHSEGDETSRSFEICLRQPQIVHIPNSFTPGITEGQNDKFGPKGLYIKKYEMQIFNRWGEEIFSTESGEPWDGTYEGQPAPVGVYLYSITVRGEDGRTRSYEGSVNVVR